jgi:glycerate 2-kinase
MHAARGRQKLRDDALAIWNAGVAAVQSDRLVRENVRVDGNLLLIGEGTNAAPLEIDLSSIGRIAVVGAGKAGAGMAAGLEQALDPRLLAEKQVQGWINVPADCVQTLSVIQLHGARPAGVNEPTAEGIRGTERILEMVSSLGPDDLCLCLISGGGSALLLAPVEGVSLADKQAVTRLLSAAGANIQELNTVRKQLSRVKGGGLARACRAGRLITLIISDVLGDPLDVIASGPTVPNSTSAADALVVLERYAAAGTAFPPAVLEHLQRKTASSPASRLSTSVTNLVIGNNALAVDAAGIEAERRGYSHAMIAATNLEAAAEAIGVHHARMALEMLANPGPDCLITGGEPTVKLAPPEVRGRGGRNQQLVLAALIELMAKGFGHAPSATNSVLSTQYSVLSTEPKPFVILSGGTDGEDGPTDAAGASIDAEIVLRAQEQNLDPADFLRRSDAYSFFEQVGGLLKTGPTHTNVCDIRIVLVNRAT